MTWEGRPWGHTRLSKLVEFVIKYCCFVKEYRGITGNTGERNYLIERQTSKTTGEETTVE